MAEPRVGIIVPTRNAGRFLDDCLAAVRALDYPQEQLEIIVVDNFSTDDTSAVASKYGVRFYQIGPERSAQRNFGAAQATGEFLLFLDADMMVAPTLVRACLAVVAVPDVIAAFIPEKIVGTSFWISVQNFERSFYNTTPIDAVRFIHRATFVEIGGYDPNLCGPEDWDLDRRLAVRGRFALADTHLLHNEGKFDFRRYIRKKAYYAQNFATYFTKWGRDAITKKQFGLWYRYFGVFLEQGKWKRFLSRPIHVLALYCLRFAVGIVYLRSKFGSSSDG